MEMEKTFRFRVIVNYLDCPNHPSGPIAWKQWNYVSDPVCLIAPAQGLTE